MIFTKSNGQLRFSNDDGLVVNVEVAVTSDRDTLAGPQVIDEILKAVRSCLQPYDDKDIKPEYPSSWDGDDY